MRLIDADALVQKIADNVYPLRDMLNSRDYGMFWTGGIEKIIDEAPTVEERKRGVWEALDDCCYRCSVCGFERDAYFLETANFCPNCGADMRGEANDL